MFAQEEREQFAARAIACVINHIGITRQQACLSACILVESPIAIVLKDSSSAVSKLTPSALLFSQIPVKILKFFIALCLYDRSMYSWH